VFFFVLCWKILDDDLIFRKVRNNLFHDTGYHTNPGELRKNECIKNQKIRIRRITVVDAVLVGR
jgi:hypothetical protein